MRDSHTEQVVTSERSIDYTVKDNAIQSPQIIYGWEGYMWMSTQEFQNQALIAFRLNIKEPGKVLTFPKFFVPPQISPSIFTAVTPERLLSYCIYVVVLSSLTQYFGFMVDHCRFVFHLSCLTMGTVVWHLCNWESYHMFVVKQNSILTMNRTPSSCEIDSENALFPCADHKPHLCNSAIWPQLLENPGLVMHMSIIATVKTKSTSRHPSIVIPQIYCSRFPLKKSVDGRCRSFGSPWPEKTNFLWKSNHQSRHDRPGMLQSYHAQDNLSTQHDNEYPFAQGIVRTHQPRYNLMTRHTTVHQTVA